MIYSIVNIISMRELLPVKSFWREKMYTMKQVCGKTGLSYDTLKYYCNEGLVPNVKRDQNNRRVFSERDIAWIKSLQCLKNCEMSLAEIQSYIHLCKMGKKTIPKRMEMLKKKSWQLRQKIHELEASIDFIEHKQQLYQDMLEGKVEYYSNLVIED